MKKAGRIALIVLVALLALFLLLELIGYILLAIENHERVKNLELSGDTITVTDEYYVQYLEELCIHTEKYMGRQIVIEGDYDYAEEDGVRYHLVGRMIDMEDDCGEDEEEHDHVHMAGLQFKTDDQLPERGARIRVQGTLGTETEDGEEYIVLDRCTVKTVPEP